MPYEVTGSGRLAQNGPVLSVAPARTTTAPAPELVRLVRDRLRGRQGPQLPRPQLSVLDELVATVLSQHTSDRNSERAFASLRRRFPAWQDALAAPVTDLADAIRAGGIADRKARRIQEILSRVASAEGRLDLERLRELPDAEAEGYLLSLPGVGPKTAACVLAFAMGRAAFPVDTHVHRVTGRLGWIPPSAGADQAHRLLARCVPADLRLDLHLALVAHGRAVCRARRPACGACSLRDVCPYPGAAAATGP